MNFNTKPPTSIGEAIMFYDHDVYYDDDVSQQGIDIVVDGLTVGVFAEDAGSFRWIRGASDYGLLDFEADSLEDVLSRVDKMLGEARER